MQEIELKFLVPDAKIDAIKRQTHVKSAVTETLAAHYLTPQSNTLLKQAWRCVSVKKAMNGYKL